MGLGGPRPPIFFEGGVHTLCPVPLPNNSFNFIHFLSVSFVPSRIIYPLSSLGRSPGRAIVLPSASALAAAPALAAASALAASSALAKC